MPNDAKAQAYEWVAAAINLVLPGALHGAEVTAEIKKIRDAMLGAAEHRGRAPVVPPPDLTMVAPGTERQKSHPLLVSQTPPPSSPLTPERIDAALTEGEAARQRVERASRGLVLPEPKTIASLPEMPVPPCPKCGAVVDARAVQEHVCSLPVAG